MTAPLLEGRDLTPLSGLDEDDIDWLKDLQAHLITDDCVVRLGEASEEPEPVVGCAFDGSWRCGRYIGSISFRGRRLEISPRFNLGVIEQWLAAATNVMIVPGSSRLRESSTLVPYLLALLWCRELDRASRHGPPFLRERRRHSGTTVRGRLSVRETARLRATGRRGVASISAERSLDNDIARMLVIGQRALKHLNGGDAWMTQRAKDILPHLWEAVGTRPRMPRERDLNRIRYTPIRRPYRALVELSWRIARQRGYTSAGEGEAEGLLLDVAELWERFVLQSTRQAVPPGYEVTHGARETLGRPEYLMRSQRNQSVGLARMWPDIVVRTRGEVVAVIDAKYKRLVPREDARQGVALGDAYQIAGYVTTLRADPSTLGMLAYPREPDEDGDPLPAEEQPESPAEDREPWSIVSTENPVRIRRLPVDMHGCAKELSGLLAPVTNGLATVASGAGTQGSS